MIALVATLGLTLLALALLGGIAFVVRGSSSVRRANTLPDRPFVPTEIDASRPLYQGEALRCAAKQGKRLHRVKRAKRARGRES